MVENDAASNIPSLDEFLATVGPLNPEATNKDLIDAYQTHFGVTVPPPETRATLPSLEEFTQTLKPLNPGATDEDLRQAWQEKFGVLGAREKKPTFTESVSGGFQQGLLGLKEQAAGFRDRSDAPGTPDKQFAKDAGDQLAEAAKQYNVPADLEEQSVWKKFTDPEYLGHVIGQQLSGNIPSIGGAIVGGLAGTALGGPVGGMAGATAGMGGATFLQRAGEAYREAFQKNKEAGLPDEEAHDKAYTQSGIAGTVSGVINGLAVPLTLVRPFTGVLKNLLLQYAGNVAIDTADQATGNVVMDHPIGEGVPEAAATSMLFGAPETMAGVKAALHTAGMKERPPTPPPPPSQTVQPTPPSSPPSGDGGLRKDPLEIAKPITDPNIKTVDEVIDRAKKVTDDVPINIDDLEKAVSKDVSVDTAKIKEDVEKSARDAELKTLDDKRKQSLQDDQVTLDTLTKYTKSFGRDRPRVLDPETLPDTAPSSNPQALTKSGYLALADMLAVDGTRLVPFNGTMKQFGFISPETDQKTAWINANSTIDPTFVAFHEVQHIMQRTEVFDAFRQVVLEELKPNAYQAAQLRHGRLGKDRLFDEMLSDVHGDAMMNERFHKKLIQRLEAQENPEKAQTKLTQFLDGLKEMIARVKEHLTGKAYTDPTGQRIVDKYVSNLERVHDALAGGLAEHYRLKGISAELPVPEAGKETYQRGGKERIVVHPDAVKAFSQVATQRHGGARVSALNVMKNPGVRTGASMHLSNLLHHLMASAHEGHANQGTLKDLLTKLPMSFHRVDYTQVKPGDLARYVEEHKKLPVYNQVQWVAREAAVAYGEKRIHDAARLISELTKMVNAKDFNRQALSFKRGGDGKLAQHLNEVEGEMVIEKGAKEPKYHLSDGREVTQSEMEKSRQRVKPTKLSTRDEATKKDVAKPKEIEYKKENVSSTTKSTEGVKTGEEGQEGQGREEGLLTKKTEPSPKSAPSPTDISTPESFEDRIPKDLQVSIRALRESTGEMVMTKEDARTALKDLDESLAKYQQLLKCVQS